MALVSPDSIPHIHNHPIWHNLIHSIELHSAHFQRALNWAFFIDLPRNMFHWNFHCAELSSTVHFWTKLCHTRMWRRRGRYFVVPRGEADTIWRTWGLHLGISNIQYPPHHSHLWGGRISREAGCYHQMRYYLLPSTHTAPPISQSILEYLIEFLRKVPVARSTSKYPEVVKSSSCYLIRPFLPPLFAPRLYIGWKL